jgi:hypothetical protein
MILASALRVEWKVGVEPLCKINDNSTDVDRAPGGAPVKIRR